MNITHNRTKSAVRILGDYSKVAIYATLELVNELGGENKAFHELKRLSNKNWLPRQGSETRPLTLRDLTYARKNEQLGRRHWQFYTLQGGNVHRDTGYDWVYGYGYQNQNHIIIVDSATQKQLYKVEVSTTLNTTAKT